LARAALVGPQSFAAASSICFSVAAKRDPPLALRVRAVAVVPVHHGEDLRLTFDRESRLLRQWSHNRY
jgi:hypothetical protein